ncbi:hypothetical protein A6046_03525 [[Haemophilus] ducreyi]|nr:hypothetical protein RZ58_00680 [[Haemophilus] ducreyi]ANF61265.1 hypothetical protein A6036_07240 [[Haemophilus] ducreyi]ANF64056.1 hypothetical protein A6038_01705 [[Haemophilus] ducreyi]ANF65596.1 hypothetical protein A6039_07700 [[Haemophilus] ducreyi]ANF67047.1 hypothetical protein A6040_04155 [[Haemophilus] ducreyi]
MELLLALTLSVLLLFPLSTLYTNFYRNSVKQQELLFLQKESHQLLNYLKQHSQHIGYQGVNRQGSNFSLFSQQDKRYKIANNQQCLIFFYDLNGDGCLGKRTTKKSACVKQNKNTSKELVKEVFGIKVENKQLYIFDKNKLEHCIGSQCSTLLDSCQQEWKKFTSLTDYMVDKLRFSVNDKQEKLLKIEVKLTSVKQQAVSYTLVSYIYLLNNGNQVNDL